MNSLLLLLMVCSLTCLTCTRAEVLENPLQVFETCVTEKRLPSMQDESNPLLKTIFEMIHYQSLSDIVLKCVHNKTAVLRNSTEAAEWFVGYTFDLHLANQTLHYGHKIYNTVKAQNSTCLRDSLAPAQTGCLQMLMHKLDGHRSKLPTTIGDICSWDIRDCLTPVMVNDTCNAEEKLVDIMVKQLFYGQCLTRWNQIPDSPTASLDTVLFKCGIPIFQSADPMLFPPSEAIMHRIANVTAAAEFMRTSLRSFCSQVTTYGNCVQQGLRYPTSAMDTTLTHLLDVDNLPAAFSAYCRNADMISSKFQCTHHLVQAHHCSGGIIDLISALAVEMTSVNTSIPDMCMQMNAAQACRVEHQLTPCGGEYGKAMATFYDSLKKDTCTKLKPDGDNQGGMPDSGNSTSAIEIGEFVNCGGKYVANITAEIEKLGGGMSNIVGVVSYALNYVCGVREEWMQCIRYVHRTSTNPIDKFILKIWVPDNLDTIFKFTCSKRKLIEKHAFCLVASVGQMIATNTSCMTVESQAIEKNFSRMFHLAGSIDERAKLIPEACATFKPVTSCMKPMFERCNADLAEYWEELTSYSLRSCGKPEAVSMTSETSGGRGCQASSVSVMAMLTLALKLIGYI